MLVDLQKVLDVVREAAEAEVLPRFKHLETHQIREKKPGDLVTDADIGCERLLSQRLRELLPGSLVVGEEAVAADASVLDRLDQSHPVWIIDPVDGTRNFATGRPLFAVVVALVAAGRTVMGLIHDPVNDVTAMAEEGSGTWIGERRLMVAKPAALAQMDGSIGYRRNRALEAQVHHLVKNGSAAHDYLQLLQGRIHFAYYRRLNPWDHAAGVLMHAEAGGYAALLDGAPYQPRPAPIGVLLAPDRETWNRLQPLVDDRV